MPGTGSFRKMRCSAEWPHSSSCPRSEVVAGSRISDGIFARNRREIVLFADALFYYEAARSKINRRFHSLITFLGIQERPFFVASPEVGEDDHTCNRRVRTP
jgi:hypothetical protein